MYACEMIHCLCFDFLSDFMSTCFLVGVMCSVMFLGGIEENMSPMIRMC